MVDLYSPVAPCIWPFLNKPDTRWDKDGKYRVSLVFSPEDPWLQDLEALAEESFNEIKASMKPALASKLAYNSPVRAEFDAEGEATGNMLVEFQTRAYMKDKQSGAIKPISLKFADATGKPIKGQPPMIGSGSELCIKFKPSGRAASGNFYFTLYLNAVQIVNLEDMGGGFTAKEGGYAADDALGNADTGVSGAEQSEF